MTSVGQIQGLGLRVCIYQALKCGGRCAVGSGGKSVGELSQVKGLGFRVCMYKLRWQARGCAHVTSVSEGLGLRVFRY